MRIYYLSLLSIQLHQITLQNVNFFCIFFPQINQCLLEHIVNFIFNLVYVLTQSLQLLTDLFSLRCNLLLFTLQSLVHRFSIVLCIFISLSNSYDGVIGLLAPSMISINFAINTNRLIAVHAEELILSLGMILTVTEVSRLLRYFNPHMLLEVGSRLMNFLIAVITIVTFIIFAVNSCKLPAIIAILLHTGLKSLMLWYNSELH